ncbi:MAG: hypothetical protein V1856_01515 [Candidatus Liptonbacteria bacterium]
MSMSDDLMEILSGYSGVYRVLWRQMHGRGRAGEASRSLARERWALEDTAMRVALSRLKKKGWVENKGGVWSITKRGLLRFKTSRSGLPKHSKEAGPQGKGGIIITFDIPEKHKSKRFWLREELIALGFKMLQKSVWLGRLPLPKKFVNDLKEIEIINYMKFFEAKEAEII